MITMSMIFISLNLFKSKNPMKTCWKLMLYMKMFCIMMTISTASTFYPLMMVMVMVGGLLIMYMIMSSMLPNNPMKTAKMNFYEKFIWSLMIILMMMSLNYKEAIPQNEYLKMMVTQNTSFWMTIITLMFYFYSVASMMETEETSLRSYQ